MKAIYLDKKAGSESLISGDIPQPEPKRGEILVEIHATAVTPTELEWFPTFHTLAVEPRPFPIVLSHEFSGVVAAVGDGVFAFREGDPVYGLNDWFVNGAQAEFCVAPASAVSLKPRLLDFNHAAVTPISALTAWQGLFEKADLQRGQRILVHGAAGGVGLFAVQLARWRGAHVTATSSTVNIDFARTLGAHQVIDYQTERFEDHVRDVDVVFDCVGGETLDRSWAVLSEGGKAVTIASQSRGGAAQRVRDAFMLVRPDGEQLSEIAKLIDSGDLRVHIDSIYPLDQAREAYARAGARRLRGKIALCVRG